MMEPAPEADADEINPQTERGCQDAAIGIGFGVGFGAAAAMSIGGSPWYGVYDIDFGLGQPSKVELVSIDKTPGTVSLAKGDGAGIEIGVVLPEAKMAQFSSCFSDGLKRL